MPAYDGAGLDEDQSLAPVAPGMGQQDPEHPVTRPQAWPADRALQGPELLTQGDVFQDHFVMAATRERKSSPNQHDHLQHVLIVPCTVGKDQRSQREPSSWQDQGLHAVEARGCLMEQFLMSETDHDQRSRSVFRTRRACRPQHQGNPAERVVANDRLRRDCACYRRAA